MIYKTMANSVISVWPYSWFTDDRKRDADFLNHIILQAEYHSEDVNGQLYYLVESIDLNVLLSIRR